MADSSGRLASFLLRCAAPLFGLRRIPVLGNVLSWTSRKLVPLNELVWVQIQEGPAKDLWIRVNPRTGQHVRKGIAEPQVQKALSDFLRPGMTFYDLGANIGFFSLIAAQLVGTSGHVVAFEADPEIAARLRENLAYNKFDHATIEQKAVWFDVGMVSFARADINTSPDRGLGHVTRDTLADENSIAVEAISLDAYTASHPVPDFLKCDVEGAEVAVFQGAARLLAERRLVLLVEMHSEENHRVLRQKFTTFGYACSDLDENHVLALPQ